MKLTEINPESETKMDRYNESLGNNQKWVKINKIVVESEHDKQQLLLALKYLHDGDIDTDYMAVNSLVHMYENPDMIEVSNT